MDEFFSQLKEYLKMDTEISYEEFAGYHKRFSEFLNGGYEGLNRDDLVKARYIYSILQANSWERSRRRDNFAKKYKKISEKCTFWADAIKFRLEKEGMTAKEIDAAHQALMETD